MQKVGIFDRVLCIIILTVSSIKMQTEYWCKLFYIVLSAVGEHSIKSKFTSVLIHYKIVGYLDPPIQCVNKTCRKSDCKYTTI